MPHYSLEEKKTPFRSWPISANELEDVPSVSDSKTKSPTLALHCICAELRTNSPAKPPYTGSVFRILTLWFTPCQSTLNDTTPGTGGGPPPNNAFPMSP